MAVISRDKSRLEKLRSFVSPNTKDRLTTVEGDVGKSGSLHLSPQLFVSCPSAQ